MNTPKVSILIPIYNVEKYLPRCLDSVFSQTYQNVEYVFVDDCSTDHSHDVLREKLQEYGIKEDRYTLITHSKNENIAVSRIDCLSHAHGDYVQFVDSDDWIEPNMTSELVAATKNGSVDIVTCNYIKDFSDGKHTYHKDNFATSTSENMVRSINYDVSTVLWKLLIRRTLFDKFEIDRNIDIGEDYIMSIKLFYYASTFAIVDQYLYHYVQYNMGRLTYQSLRSVLSHVNAVNEVESFFRKNQLLTPSVEHLLKLRKFNIRRSFLSRDLFNLELYRNTFPESSKMNWWRMNYSRNDKIKFWLAERHLYFILKMINKLKR